MLNVLDFSKNKLHRLCFNNNFQGFSRTNIFENVTEHIFLIVVLMVDLCLNNQKT